MLRIHSGPPRSRDLDAELMSLLGDRVAAFVPSSNPILHRLLAKGDIQAQTAPSGRKLNKTKLNAEDLLTYTKWCLQESISTDKSIKIGSVDGFIDRRHTYRGKIVKQCRVYAAFRGHIFWFYEGEERAWWASHVEKDEDAVFVDDGRFDFLY